MSRHAHISEHMAAVPMFYACTKRELQTLSRLATEIDIPAGKVLTTEGEPGQEFMIVLSGTAVATVAGRQVATFGPGQFFGEIALLDPGLRTATVVAQTPMTIAVVGVMMRDVAHAPPSSEVAFREGPAPTIRITGSREHPLTIGEGKVVLALTSGRVA